MIDKYINPHTDFGFKRLFGSEFSEQDQKLYEDSMNAYRDIVNAIRTAEKKKYAAYLPAYILRCITWQICGILYIRCNSKA